MSQQNERRVQSRQKSRVQQITYPLECGKSKTSQSEKCTECKHLCLQVYGQKLYRETTGRHLTIKKILINRYTAWFGGLVGVIFRNGVLDVVRTVTHKSILSETVIVQIFSLCSVQRTIRHSIRFSIQFSFYVECTRMSGLEYPIAYGYVDPGIHATIR